MQILNRLFAGLMLSSALLVPALADSDPALVRGVNSIVDLKAIPAALAPGRPNVSLKSYIAGKAKGGGPLSWAANSSVADNGCTVFAPNDSSGNGRWLRPQDPNGRIADTQCGVVADGTTDDTVALRRAIALFSSGRAATATGSIQHCGDSIITAPVVYGGSPGRALTIEGCIGHDRFGNTGASFTWGGAGWPAMFVFYGANESGFRNVNLDGSAPGTGLVEPLAVVADNVTNATITSGAAAGPNSTFTVVNIIGLAIGRWMGMGAAGASNFEVVEIKGISGTTITAALQYNHISGEQWGGSAGSSGVFLANGTLFPPVGVNTTLSGGVSAGTDVVITPVSMTGITVGLPIYIGGINATTAPEVSYVKTIGASSFTADISNDHGIGERVVTLTAGVAFGNQQTNLTDQVSETRLEAMGSYCNIDGGFAGALYIGTGNVKNHRLSSYLSNGCLYMAGFDGSSGSVLIDHAIGGQQTVADFWLNGTAKFHIDSLETEDQFPAGARLFQGQCATNSAVEISNSEWIGIAPPDDYGIQYGCALFLHGNAFNNTRTGSSVFKIQSAQLFVTDRLAAGSIVSQQNYYQHAGNFTPIFYDGSGNAINYSMYPALTGVASNVLSFGDYGDNGNIQPTFGQQSAMGSGATIDSTAAGQIFNSVSQLTRTTTSVTIPFTAFQTAALSTILTSLGIPSNERVVGVLANVTQAFAGPVGTLTFRTGTSSGGQELLLDADVKSGAVVLGDTDGELGSCLARASAVQGGCTLTSLAAGSAFVKLTSSSGNLSTLSAGSVTLYLTLERLAP